MITVYEPKLEEQQRLFRKAEGTVGQKLTSMGDYFQNLQTLVENDASYALIPSPNEDPLKIDANSRTITVPTSFAKCAGVANDNMSEIITFVIDRYFDYVDLNTTQICIRWSTDYGAQGISNITLKSTDLFPGKLYFGWPLTNNVTSQKGKVTFSVRFFIEKNDEQVNSSTYELNTLPASFPILDRVNFKPDEAIVDDGDVSTLLSQFIVEGSGVASYEIAEPAVFNDMLPPTKSNVNIDVESDTLSLRALAISADRGLISYEWLFKENVSEKTDSSAPLINITKALSGEDAEQWSQVFEITDSYDPLVNAKGEILTAGDMKNNSKYSNYIFYKKNDENTYNETLLEVFNNDEKPLVKFSKLTLLARKKDEDISNPSARCNNVTGVYWVLATNTRGDTHTEVTPVDGGSPVQVEIIAPSRTYSNSWYLSSPQDIKITRDLETNQIIDTNNDSPTGVEVNIPNAQKTWYKTVNDAEWNIDTETWEADEFAVVEDEQSFEAGWYKQIASVIKNRKINSSESQVCRVVNPVALPSNIQYFYQKQGEENQVEVTENNSIISDGYDIFTLSVTHDAVTPLTSDGVKYAWYCVKPDMDDEEITETTPYGSDDILAEQYQGGNELVIRVNASNNPFGYKCIVTNTLADTEINNQDSVVQFIFV